MRMKTSLKIAAAFVIASSITVLADTQTYEYTGDGTISHSFFWDPMFGFGMQQDTLASTYGKGSPITGTFSADFSSNKTFTISFLAPEGTRYSIDPSSWLGKGDVYFNLNFNSAFMNGAPSYSGGGVFEWIGATGNTPTVAEYGVGSTFNLGTQSSIPQALDVNAVSSSITEAFAFTGFTYTVTAPAEFTAVYDDATWYSAQVWLEASANDVSGPMSDPGSMVTLESVPEPSSFILLGFGAAGLAWLRRKTTKRG